jgi:peptide/nickel transport system substrate-binding protein
MPKQCGSALAAWSGCDATRRWLMRRSSTLSIIVFLLVLVAGVLPLAAQDKPRNGGELVFVVPSEPPSYDGHQEETFGVTHPIAPHYNTLLRVDPMDKTGTKPVGDLAESWTVSKDSLTYTFKIRKGVKFHDGSELTSKDIKATYDKILKPPAGVKSLRKEAYEAIGSIDAPDPNTFVVKLKYPEGSILLNLASPWNFVYKADILAKDPHYYEKHIMGTGPFKFGEHVKGSHWVGKKNPDYWDKGKPYLDSYRAIFISASAAQVAAIRGERAMIQFRGFSPAERDTLQQALGNKLAVQESPWNCLNFVSMHHEKKPFDDKRVRRALSLALDRYEGSKALSKITLVKDVAGIQVPGTPWATPPAELEKLAGYGRDIAKNRAEAKRLLKEAGVADGFGFTFKNRGIPHPYEHLGIWLIDQWRQIGLNVKMEMIEASAYHNLLKRGDFEVAMDFQCGFIVEPDLDLPRFISTSDANYGKHKDTVIDDLMHQQGRAIDPEQRKKILRQFEKRLLDDEAHVIYTLQWHRIIPHLAKVKNWTITPSHYLNNQLDAVWLSE